MPVGKIWIERSVNSIFSFQTCKNRSHSAVKLSFCTLKKNLAHVFHFSWRFSQWIEACTFSLLIKHYWVGWRNRPNLFFHLPSFSDYKAHRKSLICTKNRQCALYSGAPDVWTVYTVQKSYWQVEITWLLPLRGQVSVLCLEEDGWLQSPQTLAVSLSTFYLKLTARIFHGMPLTRFDTCSKGISFHAVGSLVAYPTTILFRFRRLIIRRVLYMKINPFTDTAS